MSEDTLDKKVPQETSQDKKSHPAPPKKSQHKKPANNKAYLASLLSLLSLGLSIAIIIAGYGFWEQQNQLADRNQQRAGQYAREQQALGDSLQEIKSRVDQRLSMLQQNQSGLADDLGALLDRSGRLRNDWLISEAEYLIRLASHRLLLDRDIRTARLALETADQRLRETGDPLLIPVRKTLAKDVQALKSVAQADITGLSLQLTALSQQVEKLPLRIPDPESAKTRQPEAKKPEETDWWANVSKAWEVLSDLIVIREHAEPVQPLIPPEQRFFLVQNLALQLEQARIALLRGEEDIYLDRIGQSGKWIQRFFDTKHASTRASLATLEKLQKQKIAPPLPDITESLKALKKYRKQHHIEGKENNA